MGAETGRRLVRWTSLILLAGVAGAVVLADRSAGPSGATAQTAPPPAPPVTVSVPVQREVVEWNEYPGRFTAVDEVEIRPRVSGYLTEIHFTDGQIVHKGDLLFVIDPRPFEIELQQATAQVAAATAQVDLAQRELSRTDQLRRGDFASVETLDQRMQQMRGAQATLEGAKATVRSAQLDLEFSHITAPLDGRISSHQVSIGNLVIGSTVTATPTLLTTIVSLDPIYVYFDMSEADLLAYQRAVAGGKLKSAREGGVVAEARLDDETGWPHKGRLDFLDNEVDRGSGTIRARARFANTDLFITPGQFGRLRLPASERHMALLLPDAAITTDQSRKIVMTVGADGTVSPKLVELGPLIDGLREVRAGLDPADKVVIDGLLRARPGAKVTPQAGEIKPDGQV